MYLILQTSVLVLLRSILDYLLPSLNAFFARGTDLFGVTGVATSRLCLYLMFLNFFYFLCCLFSRCCWNLICFLYRGYQYASKKVYFLYKGIYKGNHNKSPLSIIIHVGLINLACFKQCFDDCLSEISLLSYIYMISNSAP